MPVSREFVITAIKKHMRYETHPVVLVCHGPDMTESACLVIAERPFNKWIPLTDLDEKKFTDDPIVRYT